MAFFHLLARLCEVFLGVLGIGFLVLWKINDRKYGDKVEMPFWSSISASFLAIFALRWVSLMVIGPEHDRVSSGLWAVFFIIVSWLFNLAESLRMEKTKAKVQR